MTDQEPLYKPYSYFQPFHQRSQRFALLVIHRGGGKSQAAINELIEQASYASEKVSARYAYIAPFLNQAKGIAWDYLKQFSAHCRDGKPNEQELSVTLLNGAKIFILGADKPDTLRGRHWNGVVVDETAQIKRSVWSEIIAPSIARRKGWITFIGTPKGKGNIFYELYCQAKDDSGDKWFFLELNVYQTKVIGPGEIEDWKESVDDATFRQEALCSFEAALRGSYYGEHIEQLSNQGRIESTYLYDSRHKVCAAFDIGYNDATAIWFWQVVKGEVLLIDYKEYQGKDADEVCQLLRQEPYRYETVWLPHDANHHTFQTKKTVIDTFIEYDFPARKVPNPDSGKRVFHGIDITRKVLRKYPLRFGRRTEKGVEALKNYSREWSDTLGQFSDKPKHDKNSHGADAFRYFATVIQYEDILRSIDQEDIGSPVPHSNTINTSWTLNDAIRDQERQLARYRQQGRPRI